MKVTKPKHLTYNKIHIIIVQTWSEICPVEAKPTGTVLYCFQTLGQCSVAFIRQSSTVTKEKKEKIAQGPSLEDFISGEVCHLRIFGWFIRGYYNASLLPWQKFTGFFATHTDGELSFFAPIAHTYNLI